MSFSRTPALAGLALAAASAVLLAGGATADLTGATLAADDGTAPQPAAVSAPQAGPAAPATAASNAAPLASAAPSAPAAPRQQAAAKPGPAATTNSLKARPAVARTAALPSLAGTTVITGSKTGYVRVNLPRQALLGQPLDPQTPDPVTITGGGEFAAFALVKENSDIAVVGGHSKATADLAKKSGEFVNGLNTGLGNNGERVLPKGVYRLYLIGDGKPTTVRLRLKGLTGSARFAPAIGARLLVQGGGGQNRPGSLPTGNSYSEGYDTVLPGRSLHFSVLAVRTTAAAGASNWGCLFDHKPQGPNPYTPGCVSTAGSSFADHFITGESTEPNASVQYGAALTGKGGQVAAGVAVVTASVVDRINYDHFWLGL